MQRKNSLQRLEALLASGGDARIVSDDQGMNKYGCYAVPQPQILAYGASTASTISAKGFAACERLYGRLEKASRRERASVTYAREMERIRRELMVLCGLESLLDLEIIFGASGTDLHLFATQLVREDNAKLLVIMPEACETGSGVGAALKGRHFSAQTAFSTGMVPGEAINRKQAIEVVEVQCRLADGALRAQTSVDAEVEALATRAASAGQRVLLVLTDVSKTGLIVPSVACMFALRGCFGGMIDILVDACQFRLANSTLRAYLEQGCMVALTGSKFVTGPAFCGALLIPEALAKHLRSHVLPDALSVYSAAADWPPSWQAGATLDDNANYGLLLRFEAALAELRAFRALPHAAVRQFLEAFASAIQKKLKADPVFEMLAGQPMDRTLLAGNGAWDHVPTIFPFLLRHPGSGLLLNRDDTRRIYIDLQKDLSLHPSIPAAMRKLAGKRCQLGQPVTCGTAISALRLNLDMRLIVDALSPKGRGADAVIAEALSVLDKAALFAEHLLT